MTEEFGTEASFTRIEEDVRRYWRRHNVPGKARAARYTGPVSTIYQQPLAVAGQPWAEQVHLLAATDLMARYRAMRGDDVHRRVGWACHGLSVEYVVEQSLGPYEADYDLAKFNAACREIAIEGIEQLEALARWLGVWLDPAGVYATMTSEAIGTVWKALHQLWDADRLRYEGHIVPVCPRCATSLSETEAARHTVEIEAPSIWLRLPWDGEPGTYLLAWTPLPWTLLGMVALAAHPDASYLVVETVEQGEQSPVRLLLAEAALDRSLNSQYRIVRRLTGKALRGSRFHPPFTFLPLPEGTGRLVLSTKVPLDRGTGLAPVTPAFDSLSSVLAKTHGLPNPMLMDDGGKLGETITPWRGLFPLESEPLVIDDLRSRGLLFRIKSDLQPQALCPYCETPLLSQPQNVWLVETGSGPWFVGRDRAWGTPLPVWICSDCGETTCLAGLDDLAYRTGLESDQIDPHRPAVDRLTFSCEACGGTMQRVSAVMDAAFEAAVLPCTPEDSAGAPIPDQGKRSKRTLAVGMGDKHIGWLGDLAEAAALLYGALAWEQAAVLPETRVGTFENIDRATPADALRWAAYTGTTPAQAEHAVLRPLWQFVVRSQDRSLSRKEAESPSQKHDQSQVLDRWLAARLHQTIANVTEALNACDIDQAVQHLALLVDDISNWYVPYGREGSDEVPGPLIQLLAPFVPHLAEAMHRQTSDRMMDSGHLVNWPVPDNDQIDEQLLADMAHVRRLEALSQAARAQAGIECCQPLRQALVGLPGSEREPRLSHEISALLAKVLIVPRASIVSSSKEAVAWNLGLKKERALDRGVAPADIAATLEALEPEAVAALVSQVRDGLSIGLDIAGQTVTLLPDEVTIDLQAPSGWAAAADGGYLVLLELD
jgi:isoleucyl-tRNA synthetase